MQRRPRSRTPRRVLLGDLALVPALERRTRRNAEEGERAREREQLDERACTQEDAAPAASAPAAITAASALVPPLRVSASHSPAPAAATAASAMDRAEVVPAERDGGDEGEPRREESERGFRTRHDVLPPSRHSAHDSAREWPTHHPLRMTPAITGGPRMP